MKKIAIFGASLMMGLSAVAQTADPVIMKINGKNITKSEFEYSFKKNNSDGVIDKKSVMEYVPLYVDFKLKVAEAESQRLDTLAAVRKDLDSYKEQMVVPTIVDNDFIEREARQTYEQTAARFEGEDLLTGSHILVLMRQDATAEQQAQAKVRIDSIYDVLKAVPKEQLPEKFAELAKEKSDDKGSAQRGGQLGQFGKGMMIPDFEKAAFALKAGEMSQPVKTTVGWHIIYIEDRHPFESYEFHHDNIIKFLEQRGIKEASANAYLDSVANERNITRAELVDELHRGMMEKDAEVRNLSQEYYEGTLMYELMKKDVWDKAQEDTAGQEAYFKARKKMFAWDEPRFVGIVIHTKDAATMAKVKKLLKGVAEEDLAKKAVSLNNDSVKVVRVERGIFKQGDNQNVDKFIFGQNVDLKPMSGYPETDVWGKKVKAPRSAKDVKGEVLVGYQDEQTRLYVEKLREKYPVEVYEDVVKTVGN
ncbi:MAG: peptidylprolyl isomerase [Bacteroidaceae bacterium]|nr:peptidylprolyl isomerase [Bacteroidaceae bacterium]